MALQWISTLPRTGQVIADLPGFVSDWPLKRTICKYETGTGTLYLDGAAPNWQRATRPGGSILAVYDDDDPAETIQWAGLVTERDSYGETDAVKLSMVTAEGYLDRVFVGDETYSATSQFTIASALVNNYATEQVGRPGMPFVIDLENADDPALMDRTYFDSDNATVYKRLSDLAGLDTPTEFIVDWQWNDAHDGLVPHLRMGKRLGSASITASPGATFNMPGPVQTAEFVFSYSDGSGANLIRAYANSAGSGDATGTDQTTQLTSAPLSPADYLTDDLPTFEYRWTPSDSIIDVDTLTSYAQAAVDILGPGSGILTLVAQLTTATRHGGLWVIGDDVGYRIGENGETPAFPSGGLVGVGRVLSYELGETSISPVFAVDTIGGI